MVLLGAGVLLKVTLSIITCVGVGMAGEGAAWWGKKELRKIEQEEMRNEKART